jgi:hypothetical protein
VFAFIAVMVFKKYALCIFWLLSKYAQTGNGTVQIVPQQQGKNLPADAPVEREYTP